MWSEGISGSLPATDPQPMGRCVSSFANTAFPRHIEVVGRIFFFVHAHQPHSVLVWVRRWDKKRGQR